MVYSIQWTMYYILDSRSIICYPKGMEDIINQLAEAFKESHRRWETTNAEHLAQEKDRQEVLDTLKEWDLGALEGSDDNKEGDSDDE